MDPLQYINNIPGLYALGGLIILFIIYLIKPKPKDRVIPSLIFLIKQSGKSKKQSFFKKLMRDWLLLFHFLIILTLAIAAADPVYFGDENIDAEFTVLVLDVSASMHANQGLGGSGFEKMISEAKKYINSERISILLVENDPRLVLDEGDRDRALEVINAIEPKEALSPVGNAILAGSDVLGDKTGRIVVISDFINSYGIDPNIAKTSVEAKDRNVVFVNIKSGSKKNVGITNLEFIDDETRVTIHNFNQQVVQVPITVNGEQQIDLAIPSEWEEKITFKHQPGINKVEIAVEEDDFPVDDVAYISVPEKTKKKILLVTNKDVSFIEPMLKAYQQAWNDVVEIEVAKPPTLPIVDHQVVIIDSVRVDKLPHSIQDKITDRVDEGETQLIVTAQEDLDKLDLNKLLPVELKSLEGETNVFNQNTVSQITSDVGFTKVDAYYKTKLKKGALSLARSEDNSSIIAMKGYGNGNVIYYGIFDEQSDFKYDVSFPILWQQLLDYVMGEGTMEDLNYQIKDQLILDSEATISTPSKTIETQLVDFDQVGVYNIKGKSVAVNLVNTVESNVNLDPDQTLTGIASEESTDSKAKRRIVQYFIYAIIALLFLELFYIKFRGDL